MEEIGRTPYMLKVVMANTTDTMAASGTRVNFNAIRSLLSNPHETGIFNSLIPIHIFVWLIICFLKLLFDVD